MEALFSEYEDLRRSGLFDPDYYLAAYPEVAELNLDPLVHYLEEGAAAGNNPSKDFDAAFYVGYCSQKDEHPQNPLLHYLRVGRARGFPTRPPGRHSRTRRETAGESAGERAPILVAIEALSVTDADKGRSRLSVAGWALAAADVTQIILSLGDALAATATYGLPRPDIARLYPDRGQAPHSGFILSLDLPDGLDRHAEPILTVHTSDGQTGQQPLPLELPTKLAAATGPSAPALDPMRLQIDSAVIDPTGLLRVEGWVVCQTPIADVDVLLDGNSIGAAEYGRVRPDIENAQPGYRNARFSGFLFIGDVGRGGAGRRQVTVRVRSRDGVLGKEHAFVEGPQRRARAMAQDDLGFHHNIDEVALSTAGHLMLKGWAVDRTPIKDVAIDLDDRPVGRAVLGLERPEIGNLFPSLPQARGAGFGVATTVAPPAPGAHRLTLRFESGDGVQRTIALSVDVRGAPAQQQTDDSSRKLQIDTPQLIDGAAATPVRGNLEIGGWALAKAGVQAVEIAVNGTPLVRADYGLRRLDIRAAFPDWDNSLASGYSAVLPHRMLPVGRHTISVTLLDKAGGTARTEFSLQVEAVAEATGPWSLRRKMPQAEIDLGLRLLDRQPARASFTVILPLRSGKAAAAAARLTIASLAAQVYPAWRLLVVPQGKARLADLLRDLGQLPTNADLVAGVALDALPDAPDAFCGVLAAGDELGCDAFLELALAAAMHPQSDFLYADERRVNPASGAVEAFFKPHWSPDLLLATNYIGHPWCVRTSVMRRALRPEEALADLSDYELVLRCTEAAVAIRHVASVLCQRGKTARNNPVSDREALRRALSRRGIAGEVRPGLVAGTHRIERSLIKPGLVSIVIPTRAAAGMIEACLTTLREHTAYRDYEIVCIENIPASDRKWRSWLKRHADRVISTTEPFNWARFNNLAAARCRGDYLLFLNDDIEITDPDWLTRLVALAQRPEIGVVGPRLLYPDGRVQHAGMFLAAPGQARHAFRYAPPEAPGYFGLALTERDVIAVTGACLMTRRDVFARLGGFDERQSIINNDLDYCLRVWREGLLTLYTPHVTLVHHEAVSRAELGDEYDEVAFDANWAGLFQAGDPFFNPHLSKTQDDYSPDYEPTRLLITGRPIYRRDSIRKILVIKLDHIGDCVLALPAVRRLQQHFPAARISVLTSNSSRPVWAMEPCVAETITFDVFHARSGLGELNRTEADWQDLATRLAPEHFDLAIDLRKHPETRKALQYSGARYLAGFDFRGQFPWLDIPLEAEADQIFLRKRLHNGDDLANLVETVAAAGNPERQTIQTRPMVTGAAAATLRSLPTSGPLVCVHPTVGNDARQWPAAYFAAVIDRLISEDGAYIVLIGGPGDEAVAAEIIEAVRQPAAVTSLVGKLPLGDLPALISGMSLFVGNNSGPKHIAAGLGIPTVGVHSGTEDVREWGPVGPAAIAVAREVVCAPCYLADAADCRRGLACLRDLRPARVYDACKRLLLHAELRPPAAPRSAAPPSAD